MATPKLTAVLANGDVITRRSARPYVYVVAALARTAENVAADLVGRAVAHELEARWLTEVMEHNRIVIVERELAVRYVKDTHHHAEARWVHPRGHMMKYGPAARCNPEGITAEGRDAREELRESTAAQRDRYLATAANYRAQAAAAQPDKVSKGVRWTSRRELAQQYLNSPEADVLRRAGYTLQVAPVTSA